MFYNTKINGMKIRFLKGCSKQPMGIIKDNKELKQSYYTNVKHYLFKIYSSDILKLKGCYPLLPHGVRCSLEHVNFPVPTLEMEEAKFLFVTPKNKRSSSLLEEYQPHSTLKLLPFQRKRKRLLKFLILYQYGCIRIRADIGIYHNHFLFLLADTIMDMDMLDIVTQ